MRIISENVQKKQELVNLQNKVNQLYNIVKQLGEYVGWEGIENISLSDLKENQSPESSYYHHKNVHNLSNVESISDRILSKHQNNFHSHKDILMDDDAISAELSNYTQIEKNISCEEQVYRLTAQLTAAYHRIATLEDQLLSTRNQLEVRHNGFYHVQ